MKSILLKIYYIMLGIKDKITIQYNKKIVSKKNPPKVKTTDETLENIISSKCSVSRYGDGEFGLMRGRGLIFQPFSKEIQNRLKEVINSNIDDHIVCIPDVFSNIDKFKEKPKAYWEKYLNLNRGMIYNLLNKNKLYYDALVTRLYVDYREKAKVGLRFKQMKKIWEDRNVIIVEGEKSRLGIGNDLFNNSKSIKRIICPSVNAFSKYNDILECVKLEDKTTLILIALGPTATILAYDLSKEGYQAIDIGHIDIEYEWFLQGVIEKCPINNKYIGEVNGGDIVGGIDDKEYRNQVISLIK